MAKFCAREMKTKTEELGNAPRTSLKVGIEAVSAMICVDSTDSREMKRKVRR